MYMERKKPCIEHQGRNLRKKTEKIQNYRKKKDMNNTLPL